MRTDSASPLAARGLKPVALLAANREHGDRLRYMAGCRCDMCRRANTDYEKARAIARKSGDWNGNVSARKARKHLLELSRQGVGRRAVQAVTDIADSILSGIRSGEKKKIRARTERLILAVTKEQAADRALIPAGPTWELIYKLLDKGYTKTWIAAALGSESQTPALQLNDEQVTVRNAYEVRKLFERCERGGFADAPRKPEPDLPSGCISPSKGHLVHRMGD